MSIKRSIVIGQPKETQGAAQEEKKLVRKQWLASKKEALSGLHLWVLFTIRRFSNR